MTERTEDQSETGWGMLVAEARAGSRSALGAALESCRHHLLLIAHRRVRPDLRSKAGASDLVQETLLEAQRDFGDFRGGSRDEWRAWLRQILFNNLHNFSRRFRRTAKRRVSCECSLEEAVACRSIREALVDDLPSPSSLVSRDEETRALERELGRLPESYRRVILLRHRGRLPFPEVARRMGRTEAATRKLWLRALEAAAEAHAVALTRRPQAPDAGAGLAGRRPPSAGASRCPASAASRRAPAANAQIRRPRARPSLASGAGRLGDRGDGGLARSAGSAGDRGRTPATAPRRRRRPRRSARRGGTRAARPRATRTIFTTIRR